MMPRHRGGRVHGRIHLVHTRQVELLVPRVMPNNVLRMLLLLMHLMCLDLTLVVRGLLGLFFRLFLIYLLFDGVE
jgi:hypothetical protein